MKKYEWVTAHLNFNFWHCNPMSKARQGHKLKFSCSKWAFCHMLGHSNLCSSPFSPAQHNCWEWGESQHVKNFLGTGNYFFLWVNEGNYKNRGEENDGWTCSNCLDFFSDFFIIAKSWILGCWRSVSGGKNKKMWKMTVVPFYLVAGRCRRSLTSSYINYLCN